MSEMSKTLQEVFHRNKLLIGMVHLGPLLGYAEFSSMDEIIRNALYDANVLQDAGYDAILVENNYDLPHREFIEPGSIVSMGLCISELKKVVKIPMGTNVLWNDYKTALSFAKIYDLQFIRIAVFVDNVRTDYGDIYACSENLNAYKKSLNLKNTLIFTDIQVKHSELLNVRLIGESAKDAIRMESDGLIVTGKWTGDAPDIQKLKDVRNVARDFPIIIGSGADENNIESLMSVADAVIVSTSIKAGSSKDKTEERNLKPYNYRVDPEKAKNLQKKFAECVSKI